MKSIKPILNNSLFVMLLISMLTFSVVCSSEETAEEQPEEQPQEKPRVTRGEIQPAPEGDKPKFTDAELGQPGYEGWKQYFDEFVIIYTPPDSALLERVPAIATRIKRVFMENAYRLHVQVPMPMIFYLYNNTTEIEERTDCTNTCVKGNIVHYMLFTPLGQPVMMRLLPDFDPDGTPYKYVYEGIITLLNYSGKNYIEVAYIDMYNDSLPSMQTLIDNDKYLTVDSTRRARTAAAFLQYLTEPPWAPDSVLSLYKSNKPPAEALQDIFGKSPQELEEDWHEYLKVNSGLDVEY
jgi:hypothetical protein